MGLWCAVALLAAGCGIASHSTYKRLTAGAIGCTEDEITLRGAQRIVGAGATSWVAECHGREFVCSASTSVNCTERQTATKVAPPLVAGCAYDTQCKGDRICRAGACVDP